jgi:hypothetical protein
MTDATKPSDWYLQGAADGEAAAMAVELDLELATNYLDSSVAREVIAMPHPMDQDLSNLFGKVYPPQAPRDYGRGFSAAWEDTLTERCVGLVSP